jgi:hypothetical protein
MTTENENLESQEDQEAQNENVQDSENLDEELDLEEVEEESEDESSEDENQDEGSKSKESKPKKFEDMEKDELVKLAKQLHGRVKKLKTKPQQESVEQQQKKTKVNSKPEFLTRDEGILIAKGYSEDDIKVLKRIVAGAKAEGENLTLSQAIEDVVFQSFKEKKDRDRKKEKAQLGASGGANYKETNKFAKPGLSDEEHKELWKKSQE